MKRCIFYFFIIITIFSSIHFDSFASDNILIPEDSIEFNGNMYKFYMESTDWHSAKEICEKYGGHLVTITSSDENDFLISNLPSSDKSFYWIGATDEKQEGIWEWITNESFSYNNWSESNPNNGDNGENYAGFMSKEENYNNYPTPIGSWNDFQVSSTDSSGFICEWDNIQTLHNMDDNTENNSNHDNLQNENNASKVSEEYETNNKPTSIHEQKNNNDINITFHIDNLNLIGSISLIGGLSLLGGFSFIGFVIKIIKGENKDEN